MPADRHNEGKPQLAFLPYQALALISRAFSFGAEKYAAFNWMKGMSYTQTAEAVLRHLNKWLDPCEPDNDDESGYSHLAHAGAGIVMLCYFVATGKYTEYDDRASESHVNPKKKTSVQPAIAT